MMRDRRLFLTRAFGVGVLLLVVAQLLWWLIFFMRKHEELVSTRDLYDQLLVAVANEKVGTVERARGPLVRSDSGYRVDPALRAAREADHRRNLVMLASETTFVVVIILYGTVRVLRAIRREARLNEERHTFIDSVTHELKTPLASLLLAVQTLRKRRLDYEGQQAILGEAESDIRRLELEINNVLLSGRLRRGSRRDPGAVSNASQILGRSLASNQVWMEKLEAHFTSLLPDDLDLQIDEESLEIILNNLIQNALHYANERPTIELRTEQTRNHQVLLFSDGGPGIPKGEQERVFEPFYRVKNGSRPVRGTGMGLYIVRALMEAAGGRARIKSDHVGPGTCIELLFRR